MFSGYLAGQDTVGDYMVAVGFGALDGNVATMGIGIGHRAGQSGVGNNAIFIGDDAGRNGTVNLNYTVAIGTDSGNAANNCSYTVMIGEQSGYQAVNSSESVMIGRRAGREATSDSSVFIGIDSGNSTTSTDAVMIGTTTGQSSTGTYLVFLGFEAGKDSTNNTNTVAIGNLAGLGANAMDEGIFIGSGAGQGSDGTGGTASGIIIAIGSGAAQDASFSCIAIGSGAGKNNSGGFSVNVGGNAGRIDPSVTVSKINNSFVTSIGVFAGNQENDTIDEVPDYSTFIGTAQGNNFQQRPSAKLNPSLSGFAATRIGGGSGLSNNNADSMLFGTYGVGNPHSSLVGTDAPFRVGPLTSTQRTNWATSWMQGTGGTTALADIQGTLSWDDSTDTMYVMTLSGWKTLAVAV